MSVGNKELEISVVLVTHLVAMTTYLDKNNMREEKFVLLFL